VAGPYDLGTTGVPHPSGLRVRILTFPRLRVPHPLGLVFQRFSLDVQCFFLFGVVRRTFLFLSGLCCRLKQWEQLRTVVGGWQALTTLAQRGWRVAGPYDLGTTGVPHPSGLRVRILTFPRLLFHALTFLKSVDSD